MEPAALGPWRTALPAAAGLLWLPHLLSFAAGPLTECGHCVRLYLSYYAVLPGFLAGPLSHVPEAAMLPAQIVATAVIFALVVAAWRALGRRGRWILAACCVSGFAANGLLIASLLRA